MCRLHPEPPLPLPPPGAHFSICKTAQRTCLRILSIALEEELKVLDFNGETIVLSCLTLSLCFCISALLIEFIL